MSHLTHRRLAAAVAGLIASAALVGCSHSSDSSDAAPGPSASGGDCDSAVASAKSAVEAAAAEDTPWDGPTTGPTATTGKSIVFVAQSMTNPGVAGAAKGVQVAGGVIGWDVRVIDGQGTPAGIQSAFSQALASKPDGIVLGGFDPGSTSSQVQQANSAGIPLVGWQALSTPGPSDDPKLFSNVTTKVEDVAKISADWIISQSNGTAGVVVFTDKSIPFAAGKSDLIVKQLETCSSVDVLTTANVPLADVTSRMPDETSSLVSKYGDTWNYSVAINDVYFENAAAPLRAAGVGQSSIRNIGAGDGDSSALQRIRNNAYEAASVPSPLASEGWQMVDELNRAFNNQPASGYVPSVHISTSDNLGSENSWDPSGYEDAYKAIWGK